MVTTAQYGASGVAGVALAAGLAIAAASPKGNISEFCKPEVVPKKRSARFRFDQVDIKNWHEWGHFPSTFLNALSLFFPIGETMFLNAVQAHKQMAGVDKDEVLRKQVSAFVGQESVHGREHDRYNARVKEDYPFLDTIEHKIIGPLVHFQESLGKRYALAATIALEHWTGMLGGVFLTCPAFYERADKNLGLIWHWHACEETEHKAVAYDVYMRSYGYGFLSWLDKALAQLIATILLWTLVWMTFLCMVIYDGSVFNLKQWYVLLVGMFGFNYDGVKVGLLRRCFFPWLDYFGPAFHPWQPNHDNSELLKDMPKLEEEIHHLMEENEEDDKNIEHYQKEQKTQEKERPLQTKN